MSTVSRSVCVDQTLFLERVLPAVERHARYAFRHLAEQAREEMVAECVALAWSWFVRLVERGKDVARFASRLATFAAWHVMSGRFVDGRESGRDVLSPSAQRRHGLRVERFERRVQDTHGEWREAVAESTQTPPPDGAAFRIDFPAWLTTFSERNRQILCDLMLGHRTDQTARKFGVTPGRIAQLRAQSFQSWQRFLGTNSRTRVRKGGTNGGSAPWRCPGRGIGVASHWGRVWCHAHHR
jgi:hypothetical protein